LPVNPAMTASLGCVLQTAEAYPWEIERTMANESRTQEPAAPRLAFTLYAANGRVYVSNVAQKLIDLGALTQQADGYCYLLDGNQQTAQGFPSAEAALRHIADNIRFLYLDGQFTALPDLRGTPGVSLDGAARIDVMLDVLRSGEKIQDASV
jgi:hypothetical protein